MNLRKIIREEINNDLQWIKDVEADELTLSPNISFRDDGEMRDIVKNFVDDTDDIDEDLLFNLATEQGYRWSEKHQGWWHLSERVNPKSIKESNDLQWIKDINPIPEIKIGTCIVDEMSGGLKGEKWVIKSIREKPSIDLQWIKDTKSETIIEVVNSKGKSVTINKRYFEEDLINGRYKGCGKSMKESNDLQWIKDTKSDEDIAQEIVDETKIVKDENGNFRIESDFDSYPIEDFYYDYSTYFIDYLKSDYGIEDLNHVSRIWKRYKKGMGIKITKEYPINESNDFSWVDEIPIYDFHNGEYYIDISELDDDEACEVQQTILNMGIDWKEMGNKVKRLYCRTFTNKGYIIRNATLYRTTKEWDDYLRLIVPLTNKVGGEYNPITYIDGRTDLLA